MTKYHIYMIYNINYYSIIVLIDFNGISVEVLVLCLKVVRHEYEYVLENEYYKGTVSIPQHVLVLLILGEAGNKRIAISPYTSVLQPHSITILEGLIEVSEVLLNTGGGGVA